MLNSSLAHSGLDGGPIEGAIRIEFVNPGDGKDSYVSASPSTLEIWRFRQTTDRCSVDSRRLVSRNPLVTGYAGSLRVAQG